MGLDTVRKLLNIVAILGILVAVAAFAYRELGAGEYGIRPIAAPLAVATGALLIEFVFGVFASVTGDKSRAYLGKFRQSTLLFGLFLAAMLAASVADPDLAVVETAITVLGGTAIIAVAAGVFLVAYAGLRTRSREALLTAAVAWAVVGAAGLLAITDDGSGIGLIVAGALGLYFGVRSYQGTQWRLLPGGSSESTPTRTTTDGRSPKGGPTQSRRQRPPKEQRYQFTETEESRTGDTSGSDTGGATSAAGTGEDGRNQNSGPR
jgi:hypothetical protein